MAADTRLLEHRNNVSFLECLDVCAHNREFVAQWQRLYGKQLIATNTLDRMIDEATGYGLAVMAEFADFVYAYVFSTFPEQKAGE